MILHNDKNCIFLETALEVPSIYEAEANLFAIQLLHDNLNLSSEIPLVNWNYDDILIRRQIERLERQEKNYS